MLGLRAKFSDGFGALFQAWEPTVKREFLKHGRLDPP